MSVVAVSASKKHVEGFVALRLLKNGGGVWAYVPSNHPTSWRARRTLRQRIRKWAAEHDFDRLFVDTRRRNGTTYWRRIR